MHDRHRARALTPTKLRALDMLAEGNVRVGELADRVGIDDTTATRLVDRLVAAGLVERAPLAGDRRVTVVGLTRKASRSPRRSQSAGSGSSPMC